MKAYEMELMGFKTVQGRITKGTKTFLKKLNAEQVQHYG
jgi:hypothetical protein